MNKIMMRLEFTPITMENLSNSILTLQHGGVGIPVYDSSNKPLAVNNDCATLNVCNTLV